MFINLNTFYSTMYIKQQQQQQQQQQKSGTR
jgi:hypothetical protein